MNPFHLILSLIVCFSLFLTAPTTAAPLRAAWVASVHNLNFPSRAGLSAEAQKAEIRQLVSLAAGCGLNALMVQVRPEGDALYRSRLEPWSRFLTGTQGGDPGYDPLGTFMEEGARQGVAIHAWINPYRAATGSGKRTRSHVTNTLPGAVRRVGSQLWLDPGDPAVRQHVVRVVQDLLKRYPVAGLVLDDYFYPYPGSGIPRGTFPDDSTYARYREGGGNLTLGDWRRANVHALIQDVRGAVNATRPGIKFGVSPFGIYRPNIPQGVEAQLDQVAEIYCDPVLWLRQGWVDYLAPQLYWPDAGLQSYSALLGWWRSTEVNPHGVPIYPAIAVDRLGGKFNWPAKEISRQLQLETSVGPRGTRGGYILWSIGPLIRDQKGIRAVVRDAASGR